MKQLIIISSLCVLIAGCSDPLAKRFNSETYQNDIKSLNETDKKIITDFVNETNASLMFVEELGKSFGQDVTNRVDSLKQAISGKTYGEILDSEKVRIREQFIQDSVSNYEATQRRLEYEALQNKYASLLEFTPISITPDDSEYSFGNPYILKIKIRSTEGEKIRALSFKLILKDQKGVELESANFKVAVVNREGVFAWEINKYDDLHTYLQDASVDEYLYDFEIIEMVYQGEQIEVGY